eukprot:96990-Rhodomonas_salina.5
MWYKPTRPRGGGFRLRAHPGAPHRYGDEYPGTVTRLEFLSGYRVLKKGTRVSVLLPKYNFVPEYPGTTAFAPSRGLSGELELR